MGCALFLQLMFEVIQMVKQHRGAPTVAQSYHVALTLAELGVRMGANAQQTSR